MSALKVEATDDAWGWDCECGTEPRNPRKARYKAAAHARSAALKRLGEAHREEYNRLYAEAYAAKMAELETRNV